MAAININTSSGDTQQLQTQQQQRQQSMNDRKLLLCRFHLKGSCRDGENCHFSHNSEMSVPIPADVCWYFLHSRCMYGGECRFVHLDATAILADQQLNREKEPSVELVVSNTGPQVGNITSNNGSHTTNFTNNSKDSDLNTHLLTEVTRSETTKELLQN